MEDNSIDTRHWGVYANNAKGDHRIEGNTFTKSNSDWLIYVTNAASVEVKHNECAATGVRLLLQQHECDDGAELDCDARPRT